MGPSDKAVDDFHRLYYDGEVWRDDTAWLGVPTQKCPLDLWVYQQLLFDLRPDLIIETGTYNGGSALYLASICDLVGKGRVVSIDIAPQQPLPEHPRVEFITSSSTDPLVVDRLRHEAGRAGSVFVILDSDHSYAHVRDELSAYHPLVTPGSYLVVEDTNVNGHPVLPEFGPGPMEALDEFLAEHAEFEIDRRCERYLLTFNPRGYLRRRVTTPG
jgi:cephalosporin hydroxylase